MEIRVNARCCDGREMASEGGRGGLPLVQGLESYPLGFEVLSNLRLDPDIDLRYRMELLMADHDGPDSILLG